MSRLAVIGLVFTIGCAGSKQQEAQPAAEPAAETTAASPTESVPGAMSLEEANGIVAAFVARHAQPDPEEPLLKPKSLDEVLEILGRDQIDLFAAGAAYAAGQEGILAKALHAQIELSWGDADMVLADILRESAARARPHKQKLRAKAELTDAEKTELESLSAAITEGTGTSKALMVIAAAHFEKGSALAREVIAANPDDYSGYRVAADYYRLQQDWAKFDEMVAKIEAAKPDSIGLVFQRGMAAADRDDDRTKAAALLSDALDRDPGFTRAQAMLVVWAGSVADAYAAYKKLEALNPKHQIVVWAGERIERSHAAAQGDSK